MEGHGIQAISVGFLIDLKRRWSGATGMVTQALNNCSTKPTGTNLRHLIVDLPPGTGDIQPTLACAPVTVLPRQ
jgi:ATP-binding protein involved in chromosome partitioning